jgi:hypothetical protein
MFACCSIDEFDLELALEVVKFDREQAAARGMVGVQDKAVKVLEGYFDAILAPPETCDAAGCGQEPDDDDFHAVGAMSDFVADATPESPPASFSPPAEDLDAKLFNGPILRRVRDARRRAAALLEAEGVARDAAEKMVAGLSPTILLALVIEFGPDIARIVREIVARLRGS